MRVTDSQREARLAQLREDGLTEEQIEWLLHRKEAS